MSLDHLSFSPCLPEILSLVDASDVNNCQLVSHQFNNVIKRYSYRMPRLQANLLIRDIQRRDGSLGVYICLQHHNRIEKRLNPTSFSIIDETVEIANQNDIHSLQRYFAGNGYWLVGKRVPVPPFGHAMVTFLTPEINLKDGLRLIFGLLFQKYHFDRITFSEFVIVPERNECYQIISQLFRESRTSCRHLDMQPTQNPLFIFGLFEVDVTTVHLWNLTLREAMNGVPSWDHPLRYVVTTDAFNDFSPICDLVRRWFCGRYSTVNSVKVTLAEYDRERGILWAWSCQEVADLFTAAGLNFFSNRMDVERGYIELILRRRDRKVILIQYSQARKYIIMREIDMSTDE